MGKKIRSENSIRGTFTNFTVKEMCPWNPWKLPTETWGWDASVPKVPNYSVTSQITITDVDSDVIHCLCVTKNHKVFKYQILQHTEQFETPSIRFGWLKGIYPEILYLFCWSLSDIVQFVAGCLVSSADIMTVSCEVTTDTQTCTFHKVHVRTCSVEMWLTPQ